MGAVGMTYYCVTISLHPEIEKEWVDWMRQTHISDVLNTGCFLDCRMHKVLESGSEPAYVMQYRCQSMADYERYRDNFAPALQKDHTERYAGRFRGVRQILEEVYFAAAGQE